jgi:hypothetical protein
MGVRNNLLKILPLILLAAAIALSPSFSAGNLPGGKIIEIRAEDFLMLILGLAWFADFLVSARRKIEKPPLFLPILFWLSIGLVSVLTNWIIGTLGLERGFFYFLKEIEFFVIYFYVFYHIKSVNSAKLIINIWVFLAALNVGYVVYQMISGFQYGEYGTAAIGEWGVFPTGSFFLLLFIFLFNIFLYYFRNLNISKFKKIVLGLVVVSPTIGAIGSASRTVFAGIILAIFLTLLFSFFKKRDLKLILIYGFMLAVFLIIVFLFSLKDVPTVDRITPVLSPNELFHSFILTRWDDSIKPYYHKVFDHMPLSLPFFGLGIGSVTECHNQFLRNFIETGVLGSVLFLILIIVVIKEAWFGFSKSRDDLSIGLSAGLLVATFLMLFFSISIEPFIVVKPSEVYWFFAAITMAVLVINERKREEQNKN